MTDDIPNLKKLRKLKMLEIITSRSIDLMDIVYILKNDGAITENDASSLSASRNKAETLLIILEAARSSGKLDLLSYEWQLLPSQRLSITMVTPAGIREFKHEEP